MKLSCKILCAVLLPLANGDITRSLLRRGSLQQQSKDDENAAASGEEYFDIERDLNGNPHCTLLVAVKKFGDMSESTTAACATDNGGIYDMNWKPAFVEEMSRGGKLVSGESTFDLTGVRVNRGVIQADENAALIRAGPKKLRQLGRNLVLSGNKKVLVVRAVGLDNATTVNEATLSNKVFGTDGDVLNVKSQVAACSYGQLIMDPVVGVDPVVGGSYNNGVTTVNLNININGQADATIREAISTAIAAKHGSNKPSGVDYVIQCIPPGTGTWIAYAYVNWYLSVFNDDWCNNPLVGMHELGHNFNLGHATEGTNEYGDHSGVMGNGGLVRTNDDTPYMCYNAPNNYQLGWFDDRHVDLSPSQNSWTGRLVGISEYGVLTDANDKIIVRFNQGSGSDYYFSFNRKNGINSQVAEGGNQVLVQSRVTGTGYAKSVLVAKLTQGGSYTVPLASGNITITVNAISTTGVPRYAQVTIAPVVQVVTTTTATTTTTPTTETTTTTTTTPATTTTTPATTTTTPATTTTTPATTTTTPATTTTTPATTTTTPVPCSCSNSPSKTQCSNFCGIGSCRWSGGRCRTA